MSDRDVVELLRDQAWRRSGGPTMEALHTKTLEWKSADEIESLRLLLREVADSGLIYWEPNMGRGAIAKSDMLARIEAALRP